MNSGIHYINGQWTDSDGQTFESVDPATGQITWEGQAATQRQVQQAISAARDAFVHWADTPLSSRIDHIRSFGEQLTSNQEQLAVTISRDTGKPLWESRTEVGAMIGKIDLSIQAHAQRCGTVTQNLNGATGVTCSKPLGVCAVFGPFNLPGHLPNGHIIPALLAGNVVVFKPSELSAAVGHHMLALWDAAALPAGVINMVQGGRDTGMSLSQSPDLDGLFFTGSYATGLALSRTLADRPEKMLALEMGGNNPLVVWDAGDLNAAAYLAIQSAYITAGQRCTCARRLIVRDNQEGGALIERLVKMIAGIRVGRYTDDPEPFMGPVISTQTAQRLLAAQTQMQQRAGQSLVEMTASPGCPALLSPGLMDVTAMSDRRDEELFGPLLQVIRVANFDEAIHEANDTAYGLSAALFSDHRDWFDRFYRHVRAGVVNWNRQTTGASGTMPFGGVGASGNHRPAGYWTADYCSYPVASIQTDKLIMPSTTPPGITR